MKRTSIFFISMIFYQLTVVAQNDTVFLMNGHMVCGEITDTTNNAIKAFDCKRPGKTLKYDSDEIFSFKKSGQTERFFYEEQPDNPEWFSRRDFKYYMQGERDARKLYKSKGAFWSNWAVGSFCGATGSFFLGNLLKNKETAFSPAAAQLGVALITPFISLGITQLFKIKIRKSAVSNVEYLGETAYVHGYYRQARSKRSLISLRSSLLGIGLGYATYFLVR